MKRLASAAIGSLLVLGAWGVTGPVTRIATTPSTAATAVPSRHVDVRKDRWRSTKARDRLEAAMETLVGDALRARRGFGHRFELIEIESLALGERHTRARVWGFWIVEGVAPTMLRTDLLLDRHDHAVTRLRVQAYTAHGPDAGRTAEFAGSDDATGAAATAPAPLGSA